MSNYIYNGTELPALPEWDKETYPYAYLAVQGSSMAYLYMFRDPKHLIYDNLGAMCTIVSTGETYLKSNSIGGKDFGEPTEITATFDQPLHSAIAWANYNILTADGTVYLAASEPIPVTLVSTYLYNGVELPDINSILTDDLKAQYPNLVIADTGDYFPNYRLFACSDVSKHCVREVNWSDGRQEMAFYWGEGCRYIKSECSGKDGSWGEFDSEIVCTENYNFYKPLWANFDMKYEDGSVYLVASEPASVPTPASPSFDLASFILGWMMGRMVAVLCSTSHPESVYDVTFNNNILYIKSAPATLNGRILEVR